MSRQLGALVGIGAVVAAVVGGALFLVLSEPDVGTTTPDEEQPTTAKTDAEGDGQPGETGPSRRHARVPGGAALFGIVKHAADETPAAAQTVRLVGESVGTVELATDSSGAFRFESLPPGGPYAVEVDAAGFAPVRLPGIALDRSEERDLGTLLLDLAVRVEVHVRDLAGDPVSGARVSAYAAPEFGWGFDWTKAMAQMGQAPVAVANAEAGEDGNVVFDELAAGSWTFVARKEGWATTGKSSIRLRSSETPEPVVLHMAHGHTLTGRVLDENDAPIAGALVMGGGDANVWNLGAAALRVRTLSGQDGTYALEGLRPGDTPLWASPAGSSPAQIVTLRIPDVSTFDIRLRRGGVLKGRITLKESGEPVEGAKVRAMSWGGAGSYTSEAVTDAEGRYSIEDLPEGNVGNVTAEKAGLVQIAENANPWVQTAFRSGVTVEQDLEMTPAAVVSGRVTGPDGPVSGARVMIMYQRAVGNFAQAQATTDGEGRYRVDTISEGRFLVQAGAPGLYTPDFPQNWWMALQNDSLPDHLTGEAKSGEVVERDIALAAGTWITGTVQTSDGEPVAGASVQANANNGFFGATGEPVVSAEDGTFRIEGVVPSPQVTLSASKKGLAMKPSTALSMADGEPVEDALVEMQPLPVVRGRVTVPAGDLPEDAYVQVITMPDFGNAPMRFDPSMFAGGSERHPVRRDGSFEVTISWAQGAFNVLAAAPGFPAATSKRIELEEGVGEYTVDVELGEGLALSGRVISDVTSEGIGGAHVRIATQAGGVDRGMEMVSMGGFVSSVPGGGTTVVAVTDESGAFRASGLAAGDHKVTASAEGFVAGTVDARTPFSGEVSVPLAPEQEITGTVAFGDGTPVEGVTVTAAAQTSGSGNGGMGGRGPMPGGASANTDGEGRFVLRGLARGQYVLTVQNGWGGRANVQPYTSQPIPAGTEDVVLTVQQGLRIAGRIVNEEGEPVRQCWIWANPTKRDGGSPSMPVNTQAKADGTFELVGLTSAAESYTITFNAQGMGGSYTPVTMENVKPGTTGLEVVMKSGLKIEGKILDAEGKPLTQAWVMAQPIREEGETGNRSSSNGMLEADGSFTIAGLQPGRYELRVQTWTNDGQSRQLVLEGGADVAAGTSGLRLTATTGATISGIVVDETGAGVSGQVVFAGPQGGGSMQNTRTAENGSFEISGLRDGETYRVQARGSGRIGAQVDDVRAGTTGLRLEVRIGVTSTGRALYGDGSPMSRVRIQLRPVDREGASQQNGRCDEQGDFQVNGLEEGVSYAVTARIQKDGSWTTLELGTIRGGDTDVELRAND